MMVFNRTLCVFDLLDRTRTVFYCDISAGGWAASPSTKKAGGRGVLSGVLSPYRQEDIGILKRVPSERYVFSLRTKVSWTTSSLI